MSHGNKYEGEFIFGYLLARRLTIAPDGSPFDNSTDGMRNKKCVLNYAQHENCVEGATHGVKHSTVQNAVSNVEI